jgi:hypothetical protein
MDRSAHHCNQKRWPKTHANSLSGAVSVQSRDAARDNADAAPRGTGLPDIAGHAVATVSTDFINSAPSCAVRRGYNLQQRCKSIDIANLRHTADIGRGMNRKGTPWAN